MKPLMMPRKGHGLILALVVVVVMTTALGLLAASMTMGMREVQREVRIVSLIALVDAAMAETLAYLAEDEDFPGVSERPFGGGMISSEVRLLGEGRAEVVGSATYGGRQRSIRAEVLLTSRGPRVLGLR